MREVLLWLIRLPELLADAFGAAETDGLEVLILELLLPALLEGLEVLILELLLLELLEGLDVLILELLLLELLEGLETLLLELLLPALLEGLETLLLELLLLALLLLELLLLEGLEALTLELDDLEELEAREGAELFATDRLPPLDLLPLEPDFLAVTGSASKTKAKVIVNRITLTFFECFIVYMAFLL